jgi:hypothetical protein
MKKFLFLLIVLYYWQGNVLAQLTENWDIIQIDTAKFIPLPYSVDLNLNVKCIDALDFDNIIYSYKYYSQQEKTGLKITHNNGKSWTDLMSGKINIGDTTVQIFYIIDINYLSSNTIYFAAYGSITKPNEKPDTNNAMIIFTNDLGNNWHIIKFDNLLNSSNVNISYLKMLNSQEGFALLELVRKDPLEIVKIGYVLLKTINNWKSYQIIYYDLDNYATSIDIYKNEDINKTKIILSDKRNVVLSSTNCGKEFNSYFIKNDANYEKIYQLKFLNDTTYLVLTYQYKENVKESNYIYKNVGFTDHLQIFYKSPAKKEIIKKMYAYDEKNITLSKNTNDRGYIESTTNGGLSWSPNYFQFETFYCADFDFEYINDKVKFAITSFLNDYKELTKSKYAVGVDTSFLIIYSSNSNKFTLVPPQIIVNDLLASNKRINIDTTQVVLKWNKVQKASKYHLLIKSYEIYDDKIRYRFDYSLPPCLRCDSFILLDTITSDTNIVVNNIKRKMLYIIKNTAINDSLNLESVPDYVELVSPIPILKSPLIYYPYGTPSMTFNINEVKFKWESIPEAQGYALIIARYSILGDLKAIKTYSFYPDTVLVFNDFQENTTYVFYVAAMNENEISYFNGVQFSTGEFTGIHTKENYFKTNLFPNPARSTTRISLQREGNITISAVDVLGRSFPLWSGYASAGDMELDVSTLPTGSYTLLIDYRTKREAVRMIKQ